MRLIKLIFETAVGVMAGYYCFSDREKAKNVEFALSNGLIVGKILKKKKNPPGKHSNF